MKAAQVIGNDNVYTCLPISYDTLQTIYNQTCPMAITPTIIKHPEKNISAEIQQDDGMLTNQVINENLVENTDATSLDKMDVSGTTACIINQESILNKKNLPRKRKDNLKCDTCDKKFDKVSIYKKHLLIHQNVKKYKCEHCFESYNIEDNYKLHMALHQKVKPSCPLCKRQFQRLASLKSHLLMHEVEETFVCKECLAEFDREADYHKHVTSHNSTKNVFENIPYICSYCNYLFEDPKDYKEHVSYHIKIKKLVFNPKKARGRTTNNKDYNHRCPVCNKLFPKNCLLERHMRIHSGEKPFVCPKCGKDFTQKNTLQIHMLKYSGHKPYKCTLCPAEFFQKGNLRVHVEKTHTAPPNIDKMYKCTQCTCIFKKIASLNAHITRTHSGIKHIDELADIGDRVKALKEMAEQFSIPNTLNNKSGETPLSEISRVHGLSADTNETFVKLAENSVDGTLRRYIVKQRKAGDTKWFICLYCSKEFKKPSDLIRHIRIHTKEKPYKCKVCNEAFALKSTLLSHLNTHDKREYQCHICSQFFASARTLKVHAKKHNKSGLTLSLKYKCSTCNKLFSTYSKAGTHMEVHNCTNDDIEGNKLWENQAAQIPLKQPMIETVKGLVTLPAPKPRIPHAEMEEYKNRPYKCHKCNAAFMKPTHVKRHMLTHSGERNFKCELCTKAFLTSYALKEHVRFHSSEKKFACSLCPQKFVSKELLKHHQITHSSVKPYICPYCRRRFKTALLCRKHINVHRHTVNELEPMTKVDPAKTIDLVDTLSNNPFNLETINEEGVFWKPEEPDEQQPIADLASHLPEFVEQPITKPIMKPKRIVHRSESKRVVNNNNGFISYNHDIINLANNSDILVSKDGNYTIIMSEGNEIDPSVSNSNIPAMDLDSTAFINYDEYSSVNNDVYNTMLSNVKLQNSDPILMSTIGESQDSNILFMDPTLSQTSEYQSDGQSFETFNRTIFSSTNDLNINVQASNVGSEFIRTNRPTLPTHISDEKPNLSKLNFSESENLQTIGSKKSTIIDTSKSLLTPDQIGLNDNLIIALTEDEFSNVNFNLNNGLTSVADNLNLNIMDVEIQIQNNFMCNICKATFCNAKSLEKHQCIVPLSADLHNGNADDINAMILSEELVNIPQNDQITLITSFNDQLQTAPMEISTDEPANDSTDIRELTDGAQDKERSTSFEIDRWKKLENKCTYCCKSFKKASDLIRHIRTHTGERPFTCNKCNKSFSLKSTLQYHLRTHSDVRSFNFVCPVCESVFSCRATLRIHMRIHTGVKPYPCHMCQLKFRTSSGRKSHLMTHAKNLKRNEVKNNSTQMSRYLDTLVTNDTGNLQVKVEPTNIIVENAENNEIQQIEGLSLDLLQQLQSAGLLIHESNNDELGDGLMQLNYDNIMDGKSVKMMMPVQNVDIIEPNIINGIQNNIEPKLKKFECNFCHKTYTTKAVLRKHQKRHKKPFQCSKCDKKFDSQDLLDKHIKLHSGYRPFSCTYCANSFSEEGSLKTHMKRIHNVY